MLVTDVELYLVGVRLPSACCTRIDQHGRGLLLVWRRGKAYRKARRVLRKVRALRERVSAPLDDPARFLHGLPIQINPWLMPDEVYMIDGRRIVAGRRAFSDDPSRS
jgi:hypothetical protein